MYGSFMLIVFFITMQFIGLYHRIRIYTVVQKNTKIFWYGGKVTIRKGDIIKSSTN